MGITFVKIYLFMLLVNGVFFMLAGIMAEGQAQGLPNTDAVFVFDDQHTNATASPTTQFISTNSSLITNDTSTLVGSLHNPLNATGDPADIAFEQDQIIPLGVDDVIKFMSGGFIIDVMFNGFGANFGVDLPDEFFIVWGIIVGFLIALWLLFVVLNRPTI